MFPDNSMLDDIDVAINLISQLVDVSGINEATVYEHRLKADWIAEEILYYLKSKYAEELDYVIMRKPFVEF